MKKFLGFFIILIAILPAYAIPKWFKYVNDRFGYSIEYPNIFSKRRESNSGDGIWLESKDGKIKLTLSGGYNVFEGTAHDMIDWNISKDIIQMDVNHDSYRCVYHEGKNIIHHYGLIDENNWTAFWLTFPKNRKKEFSTSIKRMEKTLELPPEDWEWEEETD